MRKATQDISDWWARDRGAETSRWVGNYQRSLQLPHRTRIVECIRALKASTLLEIGCHCGPNLVRLAKEFPTLQMIGIDVSAQAIEAGRVWVKADGLEDRIQLNVGRIPESLSELPDRAFDVVLSCYTMAYLAPDDVDGVLYELGRLSTKAVIVVEPTAMQDVGIEHESRVTGYQEWRHDYRSRSAWVGTLRGRSVSQQLLEPPVDRLNGITIFAAA